MAIIFALSSWPSPPGVPGGVDKGLHWLLYCGLGTLMVRALARADWRAVTVTEAVLAIIVSAAYGATDELHQRFVAGRSAEIADLVADTAGAAAAAWTLWLWSKMKRRHAL